MTEEVHDIDKTIFFENTDDEDVTLLTQLHIAHTVHQRNWRNKDSDHNWQSEVSLAVRDFTNQENDLFFIFRIIHLTHTLWKKNTKHMLSRNHHLCNRPTWEAWSIHEVKRNKSTRYSVQQLLCLNLDSWMFNVINRPSSINSFTTVQGRRKILFQGSRTGVWYTWPARPFCAARDAFWRFSNN